VSEELQAESRTLQNQEELLGTWNLKPETRNISTIQQFNNSTNSSET